MWTGEDDPADTLLPRLIAMGADKDRVFFIKGTKINGDEVRVSGKDKDALQACIAFLKQQDLDADLQFVNYR